MQSLSQLLSRAQKVTTDNSPAILTAIGVIGTVSTAVMASKASFAASKKLEAEVFKRKMQETTVTQTEPVTLETMEQIKLVWTLYIPAVSTGAMTVTCIILANRIGSRRAAAMATVYAVSERAFTEYREKVVEKLGETKERQVREEIIQDRINRNPPVDREIIIAGTGDILMQDGASGRYLTASIEEVKKAVNDTNYMILGQDYQTVTDFYNRIGLPPTDTSDDMGWNTDKKLEIDFFPAMTPDQKPCIVFSFLSAPIREPHKRRSYI